MSFHIQTVQGWRESLENIIYAIKVRDQKNLCTGKLMNILEQIGRSACMLLMVFYTGIAEFGFQIARAYLCDNKESCGIEIE